MGWAMYADGVCAVSARTETRFRRLGELGDPLPATVDAARAECAAYY